MQNFTFLIVTTLLLFSNLGSAQQNGFEFSNPDLHRLQLGDKITVTLEHTSLNGKTLSVDSLGMLRLGIYGNVIVEGFTLKEATSAVRNQLSDLVRSTDGLRLELSQKGKLVSIAGMVKNPGPLVVESEVSVWQAIQLVGGPLEGADLSRLELRRGKTVVFIDLLALLTREADAYPPVVEAGDQLFLPAKRGVLVSGETQRLAPTPRGLSESIFVVGAVNAPGIFPRPMPFDLVTTLSMAKGPTKDALLSYTWLISSSGSKKVNLLEVLAGHEHIAQVNAGAVTLYIPSRDIINMTAGKNHPLVSTIEVMGGIVHAGRIALGKRTTLLSAISAAGGVSDKGDLSHVTLIRRRGVVQISTVYDLKSRVAHAQSPLYLESQDSIIVRHRQDHPLEIALRGLSQVAVFTGVATLLLSLVVP
ncbi:MAG: hypothetical protein GY822_01060 [Deltaproteobacteria bacterium]|nr:hypothetical protein [Deltaproteobacteria bacterium]